MGKGSWRLESPAPTRPVLTGRQGFPPGAPSWRCPQSSLFLFYKIQLSTGCRWYRCDSARRRGGTRRKAESVCSPPLISPYVRRCCLSTLLLSPVGVRAAPLDARLRVLRVVPRVPLRTLLPEDRRVRFIRRACVGCRQTVQVLPTFRASSRRRATELSFRGAVMVFLVFLEVPTFRAAGLMGMLLAPPRKGDWWCCSRVLVVPAHKQEVLGQPGEI